MGERADAARTMKRRGLIAGAAALVAGIAAKQASQPVAASSTYSDFFVADAPTTTTDGFIADPGYRYGVAGNGGSVAGVYGSSPTGYGVWGESTGTGVGVYADATSGVAVSGTSSSNVAVLGTSSGSVPAVKGFNTSGNNAIGVQGYTGAVGVGVLGGTKGTSPTANGYGVRGLIDNGAGVSGEAGAGRGVNAISDSGYGVYSTAGGTYPAVYATNTATGDGVYGTTADTASAGIHGASTNDYAVAIKADTPRYGFGVYASGGSYGVTGFGTVFGVQAGVSGNAANTYGVYATNSSTGAGGIAVLGAATTGTGVVGKTGASYQYGVLGTTTAANSTAIAGTCTGNGSSAFSGGTTNANAFAGYFQGTVVVQGNFAVTGNKSAVIQHPRTGDHRLVYCVESPESYFEDFGEGMLTAGKAAVTLDADFAVLIHTDHYHVFLTEYDGHNNLYVTNRTASGFEIHAATPTASGRFSWRVVGKRADVNAERLGKFTMPNLPLPDMAQFKAPDLPTPAVPSTKP